MIVNLAKKLFGTKNDRTLKGLRPLVIQINELEKKIQSLSDEELKAKTAEFKTRYSNGESLESIQPEAFAVVREASLRTLGMRHFDVQMIGGAVLHRGMISEMKTGEGKTLVATLAAYLNALTGNGVHVVTVNDYLARRDAEWMGNIYRFLELSVGCVYPGLKEDVKRDAYKADITYGQNNEFGFDYLRDNMKFSLNDMFQRGHHFAIVDEVDSILIDEARTPLIISGPAEDATNAYQTVNGIIPKLIKEQDYEIDLRSKTPTLTEEGVKKVEGLLRVENLYDPEQISLLHHVNNSLKAHSTMEKDVDYVVRDGQVIIVDEFTGRLMQGRRWSNGLHQAVEAKEGVKVARENRTLATVTFQNFFRMYKKLSGMTGTADTEALEFKTIYNLDVVVIPTNKPMLRLDESDCIYKTRKEKYESVVEDIEEISKTGQPILVGTISIDQSEFISRMLDKKGVKHNVLNAKQHEREAEIVAQAGRLDAVTISTNMAGRGTDIILGGNPKFLAQAEAGTKDISDPKFQTALVKYNEICKEEKIKVLEAGGLRILGTERHESRRIDNQLRGRAGRQGDPGASQFYVSLEDDLMQRFGGDRIKGLMGKLGWEEGEAIDGRILSRSIETAQKRVESMHFEARKHVTEYDDVMNKQRQVIYNLRNRILLKDGVREEILNMIDDLTEDVVVGLYTDERKPVEFDLEELKKRFGYLFNSKIEVPEDTPLTQQTLYDIVREKARDLYTQRAIEKDLKLQELKSISSESNEGISFDTDIPDYSGIEQRVFLEALDHFWNAHLQTMDELRDGIGLRGYGQKNPLYEYQKEGFKAFQEMISIMREAIIRRLSFEEIIDPEKLRASIQLEMQRRKATEKNMKMEHESTIEDSEHQNMANPQDQKERLENQRKERRKAKR